MAVAHFSATRSPGPVHHSAGRPLVRMTGTSRGHGSQRHLNEAARPPSPSREPRSRRRPGPDRCGHKVMVVLPSTVKPRPVKSSRMRRIGLGVGRAAALTQPSPSPRGPLPASGPPPRQETRDRRRRQLRPDDRVAPAVRPRRPLPRPGLGLLRIQDQQAAPAARSRPPARAPHRPARHPPTRRLTSPWRHQNPAPPGASGLPPHRPIFESAAVRAGSALDLDHDRASWPGWRFALRGRGFFVLLTTPTRLREEPAVLQAARTVRPSGCVAWFVT